jgi:uncharacterized protein YkwD
LGEEWYTEYILTMRTSVQRKKVIRNTPAARTGVSADVLIGITLVLVLLATATQQLFVRNPDFVAAVVRSVIVEKTNDNRLQEAQGELRVSPLLQIAAQGKAQDMARKGYFAHVSPEGRTPWYWFDLVGYRFSHAGENLAVRFTDSASVVRAWMNSAGHRANILNGNFTEVGIGIASGTYNGRDTLFVVQLFGTPTATASQAPLVLQRSDEQASPSFFAGVSTEDIARSSLAQVSEVISARGNSADESAPGTVGADLAPVSWIDRIIASPRQSFVRLLLVIGLVCIGMLMRAIGTERTQVPVRSVQTVLLVTLSAVSALLVWYLIFPDVLLV